MSQWARLLTAFTTGLVALGFVKLFVAIVEPNWDDLTPAITWFPAVICSLLALSRQSRPLLVALVLALLLFGLGLILSNAAPAGYDGPGIAGAMAIIVGVLFAVGAIPAAAAHWVLIRFQTKPKRG